MKKIEMFFDYFCPYCLKGHEQLLEFSRDKPGLEIIWHPCEIYKLPGNYSGTKHSDICIQGMFFVSDNGLDLWRYHKKMYDLIHNDRVNVENTDVFTKAFEGFFDAEDFRQALTSGKYKSRVEEANHFAFQQSGIHVVPTYRADGGCLRDRQEFFKMGPSSTSYSGENRV